MERRCAVHSSQQQDGGWWLELSMAADTDGGREEEMDDTGRRMEASSHLPCARSHIAGVG